MITRVLCAALQGIQAFQVTLEVDMARQGIPSFSLVGLAEGAVREARERVLTALRNSDFRLPPSRITINLAPADKRKEGSAFDLPLALGLLASAERLSPVKLSSYLIAGELSLTGRVLPVPGILPCAILARQLGISGMIVAEENAPEAAVVEGLQVYGVGSLGETARFLNGELALSPAKPALLSRDEQLYFPDFAEVKGQEHAKRAITIAAAGGHNILFIGPPGSGKTMLAQRIPGILPPLSFDEALEASAIYSVAGLLPPGHGLLTRRPFRSPHHTVSHAGLVGGGSRPKPGEISLAHRGVLFLDELPEFRKQALETLRQPMEDSVVTISRAMGSLSYPADFMLVAAMNPCPCGYHGDRRRSCTCQPSDVTRYRSRLSGPLLDRIDLHVEVPSVDHQDLQNAAAGESSSSMYAKIMAARRIQDERYAPYAEDTGAACRCNADLAGSLLEKFCRLDQSGRDFLGRAVQSLGLSARSYTRILRVGRSIADLEGSESIELAHIAEAINCRSLDRELA